MLGPEKYFELQDYNDYVAMPKRQRLAVVLFLFDCVAVMVIFASLGHFWLGRTELQNVEPQEVRAGSPSCVALRGFS